MPVHFTKLMLLCMGAFLVTGCGPAPEPTWNHDSSGFWYSRMDGSVCQFDLEKQASRTLIGPTEMRAWRIALHPEESSPAIAQAAVGPAGQGRAAQIYITPGGKQQASWSEVKAWGKAKGALGPGTTACYWCPTGKRVLIWYHQHLDLPGQLNSGMPQGSFAIFDVASRQLSDLTSPPPACQLTQILQVSPICPDGSGYLAMKPAEVFAQFVYVTWDGWEYPIEFASDFMQKLKVIDAPTAPLYMKETLGAPLPKGQWKGNALHILTSIGTVVLDLEKREGSLQPLTNSQHERLKRIYEADRADPKWTTLEAVPFRDDSIALHVRYEENQMKNPPCRLELVDNRKNGRRMLLEGKLIENQHSAHLFRSPDGRHIIARYIDSTSRSLQYAVVNAEGDLLAEVNAGVWSNGGQWNE